MAERVTINKIPKYATQLKLRPAKMASKKGWLYERDMKERLYEKHGQQGLSQDLETGCLKLAIEKHLGVQIF